MGYTLFGHSPCKKDGCLLSGSSSPNGVSTLATILPGTLVGLCCGKWMDYTLR